MAEINVYISGVKQIPQNNPLYSHTLLALFSEDLDKGERFLAHSQICAVITTAIEFRNFITAKRSCSFKHHPFKFPNPPPALDNFSSYFQSLQICLFWTFPTNAVIQHVVFHEPQPQGELKQACTVPSAGGCWNTPKKRYPTSKDKGEATTKWQARL